MEKLSAFLRFVLDAIVSLSSRLDDLSSWMQRSDSRYTELKYSHDQLQLYVRQIHQLQRRCEICRPDLVTTLTCRHQFHSVCLMHDAKWMRTQRCPTCK